MQKIYNEIINRINENQVFRNEPMSKHTSFKVGGPADIFVKTKNIDELKYVLGLSKEHNIPITIIGNGTNVLVKDKGIRGIVLKLDLQEITLNENTIYAEAGVPLPQLAQVAYNNSLSGLEFACGIPATVRWSNKNECRCIWRRNRRKSSLY